MEPGEISSRAKDAYGTDAVLEVLPHRDPFLFVERIISVEPGKSCIAEYHVPRDLPLFRGHFPEEPILPGVIILEMMAQTGAIAMLSLKEFRNKVPYLAGVDGARFKRPVRPGDLMRAETHFDGFRRRIGRAHGRVYVGEEEAARAAILFWIAGT